MHLTISIFGHEWIDLDLSRGPRFVLVDEDDLDDGMSVVHNDSLHTSVDPEVDDYAVETVTASPKPARFGFCLPPTD